MKEGYGSCRVGLEAGTMQLVEIGGEERQYRSQILRVSVLVSSVRTLVARRRIKGRARCPSGVVWEEGEETRVLDIEQGLERGR